MNGYHKFHQDLWSSRELKVVPLREHMVEISRCWQRVPQDQKELYKKQLEGLQTQYKVDLDLWLGLCLLKNMLPTERRPVLNIRTWVWRGGLNPKIRRMGLQSPSSGNLQERLREDQVLQAAESESSNTIREHSPASRRSEEYEEEEEGSSSAPSSEDEDGDSEPEDCSSTSPSSGDSSDSDSNWVLLHSLKGQRTFQQKSMASFSNWRALLPTPCLYFSPFLLFSTQSGTCWKEGILCYNFWPLHLPHVHPERKSMRWRLME